MSISSIPLEIVTEIVSHLETSFDGYMLEETIEVGKSISLVSRAFRPIGQALRWRSITIALRSTPSLARHFETYPHLAKIVRFFHQLDHVEDSQRSLRGLVGVLTETRELRGLVVGGKLEGTFEEVFKIASSLQRLETFALDLLGMCRWTPELVAALLGGFPHLRRLLFSTGGTVTREDHQEDHHLLASNHWSPKRLAHLDLFATAGNHVSRFVDFFFGALDLSVLRTCRLTTGMAVESTYRNLSHCSQLWKLEVHCVFDYGQEKFSELVTQLPQLRSLQSLTFKVAYFDGNEVVVYPNILLNSVLAAFPSKLMQFSARQLSFNDYESIPLRPLSESSHPTPPVFEALHPSASGYRPLLVWRETESGREKWYRSIPKGKTWSEVLPVLRTHA